MAARFQMFHPMKAGTTILLIFVVSACATNSQVINRAKLIEPGMSKEYVLDSLGPPGDRQTMGLNEAWQYCSTGYSADDFVVIYFYDRIVTGISTYKNTTEHGICDSFFRTIEWKDSPNMAYTQTQGIAHNSQQPIDVLIEGIDDGVKTTNQQDRNEALMDAKLQAIERAGVSITAVSTMEDFALKEQWIKSNSKGVLMPGFQVIDKGYLDDGVYHVILSGKIRPVGTAH